MNTPYFQLTDSEGIINLIPANTEEEHTIEEYCECFPDFKTIRVGDAYYYVRIHN